VEAKSSAKAVKSGCSRSIIGVLFTIQVLKEIIFGFYISGKQCFN